jgi:DNA-directed RNA polymerase specialized sigma24 family protein
MEISTELIKSAKSGDRKALNSLLSLTRSVLERRVGGQYMPDDYEDVFQLVLIRVAEGVDSFECRYENWVGAYLSWVGVCFWGKSAHLRRSNHRRDLRMERMGWEALGMRSVKEPGILGCVSEAVERLPQELRDVVLHHYYLGYELAETAMQLGIGFSEVRSLLYYAKLELRKELERSAR